MNNTPLVSGGIDTAPDKCPLEDVATVVSQDSRGLKRSRDDLEKDGTLPEPFGIRYRRDGPEDALLTVTPVALIPRSILPLSYLDCTNNGSIVECLPRMVVANMIQLEFCNQNNLHGREYNENVVIARIAGQDQLHVFQRVRKYLYSVSRLTSWTTEEVVLKLSNATAGPHAIRRADIGGAGTEWWHHAALTSSIHEAALKRTKYSGDGSHRGLVESDTPITKEHRKDGQPIPAIVAPTGVAVEQHLEGDNGAHDAFTNVVEQYLEMLYKSKASLAYFAKGPLSRARAAFKSIHDTGRQPYELAELLRSLILGSSTMEKKYKKSLLSVIVTHLSTVSPPKQSKRKAKTGFKIGKNGLLPSEAEAVRQWWDGEETNQGAGPLGAVPEGFVAKKLSNLRLRENLLQLILLLEVQAIETLPGGKKIATESTEDGIQVEGQESQKRSTKVKKPLDLMDAIEGLVDRLTIWQSLASGWLDGQDSQVASKGQADPSNDESDLTGQGDMLKDFHAQVIIPFYAARLPKLVKDLGRKFGVLVKPSPVKGIPASNKDLAQVRAGKELSSGQKIRKSQLEGRNPAMAKSSLPKKSPALTRSATDPTLLSVKRERSATPSITSFPQEGRRSLSRTSSITNAKRMSQREVDLGAMAKFSEAKAKKKAAVELELKEAIATLKKPNRGVAVKDYFDSAQALRPALQDRPTRYTNMSQQTALKGVEVNATPMRASKTKTITFTPQPTQKDIPRSAEFDPSSRLVIPASSVKAVPAHTPTMEIGNPFARLYNGSEVADTPSRPTRRSLPQTMLIPESSPVEAMPSPAAIGTSKTTLRDSISRFTLGRQEKRKRLSPAQIHTLFPTVAATDSGETDSRLDFQAKDVFLSAPFAQHNASVLGKDADNGKAAAKSIYTTLGWDDDVDELM